MYVRSLLVDVAKRFVLAASHNVVLVCQILCVAVVELHSPRRRTYCVSRIHRHRVRSSALKQGFRRNDVMFNEQLRNFPCKGRPSLFGMLSGKEPVNHPLPPTYWVYVQCSLVRCTSVISFSTGLFLRQQFRTTAFSDPKKKKESLLALTTMWCECGTCAESEHERMYQGVVVVYNSRSDRMVL